MSDLRALAMAATPGPWFVVGRPWMDVSGCVYTADDPHVGTFVADCAPEDDDPEGSEHNAAFIAACDPQTILSLLDELDRLAALNASEPATPPAPSEP